VTEWRRFALVAALLLGACAGGDGGTTGTSGTGGTGATTGTSESATPSPSPSPLSNGEVVQDALREAGYAELQSVETSFIDDEADDDCRAAKHLSTGYLGRNFARNLNKSENTLRTYTPEDGQRIIEIILSAYCPELLPVEEEPTTDSLTGISYEVLSCSTELGYATARVEFTSDQSYSYVGFEGDYTDADGVVIGQGIGNATDVAPGQPYRIEVLISLTGGAQGGTCQVRVGDVIP
jgi:hypothetical protein